MAVLRSLAEHAVRIPGISITVLLRPSTINSLNFDKQQDLTELISLGVVFLPGDLSTSAAELSIVFKFDPSFGIVDLARNTVNALGSWSNSLTVTTPEDIGRLTVEICFTEPRIVNSVVYTAGDTITYK